MKLQIILNAMLNSMLGGALLSLNLACSIDTVGSDQVKPDVIYQDYSVSYSEDSTNTDFNGTYRVGGFSGTTIELISPSKVLVNGQQVGHYNFLGTHYSMPVGGGYVSSVQIDWYSPDNVLFRNTATVKPIRITNAVSAVYPTQGYSLSVATDTLAYSESVDATIQQTQNTLQGQTTVTIDGTYNSSTNKITFESYDLVKLVAGNATLSVSRSASLRLQNSTSVGGDLYTSYTAHNVNLTVQAAVAGPKLASQP